MILVTLMIEVIRSSETSVLMRATQRHIPEYIILHSHSRKNLKSTIIAQMLIFMEPGSSFPCLREHATRPPYAWRVQKASSHIISLPAFPVLWMFLFPYLLLHFKAVSSSRVSHLKYCVQFSYLLCVKPTLPITPSLFWPLKYWL
jgi:hypothetical protein